MRSARSKREWWSRSRPRCNTPNVDSSSSKIRSRSPAPALRSTARAVVAGTAAVPRQGELAASCCAGYPTLTIGSSPQQARDARTAPWNRVCARRDDGGRSELRSSRIADLDAHREQCHRADTDDEDQQSDRVVVEPVSGLCSHDAPRPESRIHSSPDPLRDGQWLASLLVADEWAEVQTSRRGRAHWCDRDRD